MLLDILGRDTPADTEGREHRPVPTPAAPGPAAEGRGLGVGEGRGEAMDGGIGVEEKAGAILGSGRGGAPEKGDQGMLPEIVRPSAVAARIGNAATDASRRRRFNPRSIFSIIPSGLRT